ncbi:MAG: hypothetical protein E6H43_04050, partial [Betaproteobacteria bacterium]
SSPRRCRACARRAAAARGTRRASSPRGNACPSPAARSAPGTCGGRTSRDGRSQATPSTRRWRRRRRR